MGDAFTPRWASPPGDSIRDVLLERHIPLDAFARDLQVALPEVEAILDGSEPITVDLARKLSSTLGATVEFWITRDCQYRDDLARKALDEWSQALPLKEIATLGWISQPSDWKERMTTALRFFDVPDLDTWTTTYKSRLSTAHYRASPSAPIDELSLAVWLRKGEQEAASIACEPWNPQRLRDFLPELRRLTKTRTPSEFLPPITHIGAQAGVAITVVRAPKGCGVSGMARFLNDTTAHINLSARYLSDDHFWFTLFHEIAHLLLHDRNTVYVDEIDKNTRTTSGGAVEAEADAFAAETLLPQSYLADLPTRLDARCIVRIARKAEIAPGIVVGQFQHDGRIGYNTKLNGLKHRYKWVRSTLERA